MSPESVLAVAAVISLVSSAINVYMGLRLKLALETNERRILEAKGEILDEVRREMYNREMVDQKLSSLHHRLCGD